VKIAVQPVVNKNAIKRREAFSFIHFLLGINGSAAVFKRWVVGHFTTQYEQRVEKVKKC